MNEVILDIETQNTFHEVGFPDTKLLKVSLVGMYSYENGKFYTFLESELSKLWSYLERADRIIGYNIRHFDLPVLANYYGKKICEFPMLDLMEQVKNNLGIRLKLDNIARTTLGVAKTGDGLKAVEFWKAGQIEELRSYCLNDVKVTKDIYEYGLKHGKLYFSELGVKKEFPVDFKFSPEDSKMKPKVNFTLPF